MIITNTFRNMYDVHCKVYDVHCTVYNVHRTLYNVHCMTYSQLSAVDHVSMGNQ